MKKTALLLFALFTTLSFAQVTFNPGIRAGANFSHFTNNENQTFYWPDSPNANMKMDFKTKTDFYIGFLGNIRFAKFYALQPEINYSRQGAKFETNVNNWNGQTLSVSYLGLQLVNKFYFNKFNVLVGPTLEFVVDKKNFEPDNEIDLGITAGLGYDITKNFGVEARVKKGFVPVYNFYDNHTNVTFQAGVYYTFNMKK
ncbi:porin family protein [Chryseobacterium polytrichastri]|uniref:Outer membrane protein beta-barrel domain-containing protein n=1 Tax=Chryseobacterium polytrichastri TaxID=1302687 RepID=A0A1M7IML9_9FLAO|nr:porin family protein [Chryseobacterium polytrichastri]SHM42062.1 Outer membrane protein beta-barrel domain-containing protein [Chryseobacterium polytrichastri]